MKSVYIEIDFNRQVVHADFFDGCHEIECARELAEGNKEFSPKCRHLSFFDEEATNFLRRKTNKFGDELALGNEEEG